MNKKITRLLYSASEQDANLYYATRFLVPDPVFFIETAQKKILILNILEVDRGKKEAEVDQVISIPELKEKFPKLAKSKNKSLIDYIIAYLKNLGISELLLPKEFPAKLAFQLKAARFKISFGDDPFYQERMIKSKEERLAIHKTQTIVGKAIQHAYGILRASKIRKSNIVYQNRILTSEILRSEIDLFLLKNHCVAKHTIVASGKQAVDPHCEGSGPLKANSLIIMDVFPKSAKTQYFGDMTRTVIKGQGTEAMRHQWQTVKKAQAWGLENIKARMNAKKIHQGIEKIFESTGYQTGIQDGRMQGFFHGTGHGVGLDIHEAPRVSSVDHKLRVGEVVTVEPGLYYLKTGGVRLEDIVYIEKDGAKILGSCPKIMEIP